MHKKESTREQSQTIRQQIIDFLTEGESGVREISQHIGIPEKEAFDHLDHIARSIAGQNKKLHVLPCRCAACGYIFADRKRLTKPGRCPVCKKTHVLPALFRID